MTKAVGVGAWRQECRQLWTKLFSASKVLKDGPHDRVLSTIMQLQAPLLLAQLPRPLDADGKTSFNSVYGVSTSKKVKRYEIVAAVDGEAVNLYDVNIDPLVPSQVCLDADCRSRCNPPD
jgi:hypothetical protein